LAVVNKIAKKVFFFLSQGKKGRFLNSQKER
jgi:hypothetical protein